MSHQNMRGGITQDIFYDQVPRSAIWGLSFPWCVIMCQESSITWIYVNTLNTVRNIFPLRNNAKSDLFHQIEFEEYEWEKTARLRSGLCCSENFRWGY